MGEVVYLFGPPPVMPLTEGETRAVVQKWVDLDMEVEMFDCLRWVVPRFSEAPEWQQKEALTRVYAMAIIEGVT